MGIALSSESRTGDRQGEKNSLRLDAAVVKRIVTSFHRFQYSPILGLSELSSLLSTGDERKCELSIDVVNLLWRLYSQDNVCFAQEVICCLIFLAAAEWPTRLGLLFALFKTSRIDEMRYPDFILLVHSSVRALRRLWEADYDVANAEAVAVALTSTAFQKMDKNIDQGFSESEFVHWCSARFRESKTVSTPAALDRVLSSEYAET